MTGGLHFSKLSISNFRGVRQLEIDLPDSNPLHLIGSNNSCKSTILEALHLVRGGLGTSQFEPSEFDYFHDQDGTPASEFKITLHMTGDETALPAVQRVGSPVRVHGIQLRGNTDSSGRRTHRRTLLNKDGSDILFFTRTPLKAEVKEEFKGVLGQSRQYARVDEIRKWLPEVWLLTPRNLEASLFRWETGPLKRLSQLLAEKFLKEDWKFEFNDKQRKMPSSLVAAHQFFQAAVDAFPFWREILKPRLQTIFAEYVGSHTAFELQPKILALEEWLIQQLAVSFAADAGGACTPLEHMGDGWQSLIRLACLEALSEFQDQTSNRVALLLEEPETHLHPHLQRKMRSILQRLSAKGWIVVTATHCPYLITFSQPQTICRLWRHGCDVTAGVFETATATDAIKMQDKFSERGNHEMLFAGAAVLCEGKDDTWAIRSTLQKLAPTLDLDARSVSTVDVGGSGNLVGYAGIAGRLKIRWCVITDEDKEKDKAVNPLTEGIRDKLDKLRADRDACIVWPTNLEACLGCQQGKATPEWQAQNTDLKSVADLKKDHPQFVSVCEKIVAWLGV